MKLFLKIHMTKGACKTSQSSMDEANLQLKQPNMGITTIPLLQQEIAVVLSSQQQTVLPLLRAQEVGYNSRYTSVQSEHMQLHALEDYRTFAGLVMWYKP